MQIVNPDHEHELRNFYQEWRSHYPDVFRDKKLIPGLKPPSIDSMRTLFQYTTLGHIPGENILAVLQNDLYATFNTSLLDDLELIPGLVAYVTTYVPCGAWGTPEKVTKWISEIKRGKRYQPTEHY